MFCEEEEEGNGDYDLSVGGFKIRLKQDVMKHLSNETSELI